MPHTDFNPLGSFQTGRRNQQIIEAETAAAPRRNALADLQLERAKTGASRETTKFDQDQAGRNVKILGQAAQALRGVNPAQRAQARDVLLPRLEASGIDISQIAAISPEDLANDQLLDQFISFARDPGALSASQREFESLSEGLTPEKAQEAREIKLGLRPRRIGSAASTIAGEGTVESVAAVEERLSGAREGGKLGAQLILKPQIEAAVTRARGRAKSAGETFTDLARAQAALPGLRETVSQLKDLAILATSTLSGRVFDTAVKELGFGSTKGATAKAKFIAVVNNQVLPLLKPTFGAAFTVQEGESLKATMGDPNATPEEKLAQLSAFIDQKERDIVTKDAELRLFEAESLSDEDLFKP